MYFNSSPKLRCCTLIMYPLHPQHKCHLPACQFSVSLHNITLMTSTLTSGLIHTSPSVTIITTILLRQHRNISVAMYCCTTSLVFTEICAIIVPYFLPQIFHLVVLNYILFHTVSTITGIWNHVF